MKTIIGIAEMSATAEELRRQGKRIGFVPTMGFLHEGHLSLVRLAKRNADAVVMSIFVNPSQFAPHEDFTKYPRSPERDSKNAESCGTDVLFMPEESEMYVQPHLTSVAVDHLSSVLEGKSRPTHFRGVATVVAKLFNIVRPHCAVFGQKDAQQVAVIRQLVKDLNFPVDIIVAPIVREADGLAMSSRNVYLSPVERAESTVLYRSLRRAEEMIIAGERNSGRIRSEMVAVISASRVARIDYVSVADAESLEEAEELKPGKRTLVSLAVFFGSTRLIDNIIVTA